MQGYHVEKQIFERSELEGLEEALDKDLTKAAGANYDMGAFMSLKYCVQAGNCFPRVSEYPV